MNCNNVVVVIGSAYLAQSPQLYKQMAIASDFERVFTVGAGEKSICNTLAFESLELTMLHRK